MSKKPVTTTTTNLVTTAIDRGLVIRADLEESIRNELLKHARARLEGLGIRTTINSPITAAPKPPRESKHDKAYYRIVVRAKRGLQASYEYTHLPKVKASKAKRKVREAAEEIAAHEGRSGMSVSITHEGWSSLVVVGEEPSLNRFVVVAR